MNESQNIPWKRLSVEAAAIVASILLAFSIDAWWDEWRDSQRESEILVALKNDFQQNRDILQDTLAFNVDSLETVRNFSDQIAASQVIPADFDLLYARSVQLRFFQPVSATYESLISGGDFALIRNDASRAALVKWGTAIEWNNRAEGYLTKQFLDEIYPFATRTSSISRMFAGANVVDAPVTMAFEHDRALLMGNREFHNLLATRALFLKYLVASNRDLLMITDQILSEATDPHHSRVDD